MPDFDVPLSLEDESFLKELSEIFEPGPHRQAAEKKFRRKLQAVENGRAQDRQVWRDAHAYAERLEMNDPDGYAEAAVQLARKVRSSAQQQKANNARRKSTVRKASNKAASRTEAASKTAHAQMRRFPEADRKYVLALGEAEKVGHAFDGRLVSSKLKSSLGTYRPPSWAKSTTPIKVLALSVEAAGRGARTINLHPSPDVCELALGSSRGPASVLQDRIRKSFKQEFGDTPEFWIVVERDTKDRFHVHGAVVCDRVDQEVHRRLDRALMRAGGDWGAAKAAHLFQQVSKPLSDPFVWVGYVLKDVNLTTLDIDRKLFASTAEIRASARGRWETLRATLPTV